MNRGVAFLEIIIVIAIIGILFVATSEVLFKNDNSIDLNEDIDGSGSITTEAMLKADMITANTILDTANNLYLTSFIDDLKLGSEIEQYSNINISNKPEFGSVNIDNDGTVRLKLYINNYCYSKDFLEIEINRRESTKDNCFK